jgi:hypothetical protein
LDQLSLVIAATINTYIVSLGFGSHIDTISDSNVRKIKLDTIIVAAFGIMASTLSKSSFAMTLYRIASEQWMRCFLVFIIVTVNIMMNLVWILGLAKCIPFAKVLDTAVPGSCMNLQNLVKFQISASCEPSCFLRLSSIAYRTGLTACYRLLGNDGFCFGRFTLANNPAHDPTTPRKAWNIGFNEPGRIVR